MGVVADPWVWALAGTGTGTHRALPCTSFWLLQSAAVYRQYAIRPCARLQPHLPPIYTQNTENTDHTNTVVPHKSESVRSWVVPILFLFGVCCCTRFLGRTWTGGRPASAHLGNPRPKARYPELQVSRKRHCGCNCSCFFPRVGGEIGGAGRECSPPPPPLQFQ